MSEMTEGTVTREGCNAAIVAMAQGADHRLIPIWRAVRDGQAGLVWVSEPGPLPDLTAKLRRRPIILLLCDDVPVPKGRIGHGPAAYDGRALRWMLQRAGAALLTSILPPPAWYEAVAATAAAGRCGVIVDTVYEHEDAWGAFITGLLPADARLFVGLDKRGAQPGTPTYQGPKETVQ